MKKEVIIKILGVFLIIFGLLAMIQAISKGEPILIFWICYIGMIIIGIGCLLNKSYLISSQLNIITIPLILWDIDFFSFLMSKSTLFGLADYFFKEPEYDRELLKWKTMSEEEMAGTFDTLIHILSDVTLPQSKEKLEERFLLEIGTGDKGRILWPLRVALSGEKFSPGPFEILEILGREQALRRVNRAREIYMQKV